MVISTYDIIFTARAVSRIRNIISRWKEKGQVDRAQKIKAGIISKVALLKENPQKYPLESTLSESGMHFRQINYWKLKIIYFIEESTTTVIVMEVLFEA